MTDKFRNLISTGQALSIITERDGVVERHNIDSYYGNCDFWWFKSSPDYRGVEWDRKSSLAFTEKPQCKFFSFGRQRIMLLATEAVNPKIKLMAWYDSVKVAVNNQAKVVWDFARGDSAQSLLSHLATGKRYRLLISEGDGAWLNVGIDSYEADTLNNCFQLQTEINHYPVIAVNDTQTQNKQIDQVYSYLTLNNSYQPEDAKVKNCVAEFEMVQVDLWRAIFENGIFISAYSAKEGKSFNYKELKLIEYPGDNEVELIDI